MSSLAARPAGNIENIRQWVMPSEIRNSFHSSRRSIIAGVTHVMASYAKPLYWRMLRSAALARSKLRALPRMWLCTSAKPSKLTDIERSPASTNERRRSSVSAMPFVTMPHIYPRRVTSRPACSRSRRTNTSPPEKIIKTLLGSTWGVICSSSTRRKSSRGISASLTSTRQSLPQ